MSLLRSSLVAFGSGLLFGLGLAISGMLDPARVLGFLDVFGGWDPSLAFVLLGAVAVSFTGNQIARRMAKPICAPFFQFPLKTKVDRDLILGAVVFGMGWGMVGLCPGPAIASLSLGLTPIFIFVLAMMAGMAIFRFSRSMLS